MQQIGSVAATEAGAGCIHWIERSAAVAAAYERFSPPFWQVWPWGDRLQLWSKIYCVRYPHITITKLTHLFNFAMSNI